LRDVYFEAIPEIVFDLPKLNPASAAKAIAANMPNSIIATHQGNPLSVSVILSDVPVVPDAVVITAVVTAVVTASVVSLWEVVSSASVVDPVSSSCGTVLVSVSPHTEQLRLSLPSLCSVASVTVLHLPKLCPVADIALSSDAPQEGQYLISFPSSVQVGAITVVYSP